MHTGYGWRANGPSPEVLQKAARYGVLDRIAQALEIPDSVTEEAEGHYDAVGTWLNNADDAALRRALIFPHGSIVLLTTVRPIGRNEHDIDLMCLLPGLTIATPPHEAKALVGDRLRAHATYKAMLEEKNRCWRLNYAKKFHLDITPATLNPACPNGGLVVPDKQLRRWKPSHRRAYRELFTRRAALGPSFASDGHLVIRADVEPLPDQKGQKGVLRRTVQLQKRHRDIWFPRHAPLHCTISIILTTLAMRSYEMCVTQMAYDNPLDLMADTIKYMPEFIERGVSYGRETILVRNETTDGENFAEKWNADRRFYDAFMRWNRVAAADFRRLADIEGLDALSTEMGGFLGEDLVQRVMTEMTETVSERRRTGSLAVARGLGLTGTSTVGATQVRPNTHFGR